MSAVVPPGGAVAEESAKLVWACKILLNGNKKAVKSMEFLKSAFFFNRYTLFPSRIVLRQRTRLVLPINQNNA